MLHGDGKFIFSMENTLRHLLKILFMEKDFFKMKRKQIFWYFNLVLLTKGKYIYQDGRKYTGNWNKNLKHGFGIYEWPDGDIYEGFWYNGKRNGKGIKKKGNIQKEVIYKNNKKISEKIILSPSR